MEKFLAFVGVGFAAATARTHAEEMRLHGGVAPGEKLHADARSGFQNFSLRTTHEARIFSRGFEKGENIGAVETRDSAKRGDRRAHLATFQRTEETDGDAGGAGDLSEREAAARAQTTKTLTGQARRFGGSDGQSLAFEDVDYGGGIQAAGAAQENCATQCANVGFAVLAVFALRAARGNQAEGFPCAQGGRGDADAVRDFADAERAGVDAFWRYAE